MLIFKMQGEVYMLRKGVKSFYKWCIENNKQKYLDLWDYELNNKAPQNVSHQTSDKYYFKCESNKHKSFLKGINNLIKSKDLICPECNSFYEWCVNNMRHDLIEIWDYDRNVENICYISVQSRIKVYFKINEMCTYYIPVYYITGKMKTDPIVKYKNSFGKYLLDLYGENAITDYWSSKNDKTPFDFDKCSERSIWIKCQKKDYHDDYKTKPGIFIQGCRCPWCAGKKVHIKYSFACFNIDRYGEDWLNNYWCDDNKVNPFMLTINDNKTKVHIKCMNIGYHDFWITPFNYNKNDNVCPYCSRRFVHKNDSLGQKYPEINKIWSSKNTKSPFEYAEFSHKKVWLTCANGKHDDYLKIVSDYTANNSTECPKCVREKRESSLENTIRCYLETLNYTLNHEYDCSILPKNPYTKFPMPFDNEIVDLKLIIEVHGIQHYELNGWHITQSKTSGRTPQKEFEYQKWKDEYKKNYAIKHGYHYLEIPYWTIDDGTYIQIIKNKLNDIMNKCILNN